MPWNEVVGQIFGFIAVIFGFISFQNSSQKKILFFQTATAITFCIHYALIGALSGLMLNALAIIRNTCYSHKEWKFCQGKGVVILFTLLMGVLGALSWQGPHSLFMIAGLVINTPCMAIRDPQKLRATLLLTCPMVFVYNLLVSSIGGMIYESVAFASALIGIIRYRKKDKIA